MASLKRKRLSLFEKYKEITEVESETKLSKVAEELMSPLITIKKRVVENLDLLKDLHRQSYLQLLNCFKSTASLRKIR